MRLARQLALMALLLTAAPGVSADRILAYAVDSAHTRVSFSAADSGFFSPEAVFTEVTGIIHGNLEHPERSEVSVSIPVKSLRTRLPFARRRLIESGDFFKASEFPTMTFHSSHLRNIDYRSGTFELVGKLTVNGIRRQVVLEARLRKADGHLFHVGDRSTGFSATTHISRSAFGMGRHVPFVGDILRVNISLEAARTSAYHPAGDE